MITLIPAFLSALFLSPFSPLWIGATAAWVAVFLFFYLGYLPIRYRNLSLEIHGDRFVLHTGVFYRIQRTLPVENIQYVALHSSPLHRLWDICTIVAVAPGGRISMPGLRMEEAKRLGGLVFYGEEEA